MFLLFRRKKVNEFKVMENNLFEINIQDQLTHLDSWQLGGDGCSESASEPTPLVLRLLLQPGISPW